MVGAADVESGLRVIEYRASMQWANALIPDDAVISGERSSVNNGSYIVSFGVTLGSVTVILRADPLLW